MVKNSAIIVAGGAGYIGSHVCKMLYEKGYFPVVIDNLITGYREFAKWGDLVVGDIGDIDLVTSTIKKYKPLAVMHFAAHSIVSESFVNPDKYYQNNVDNTKSLLSCMLASGVNKFVFSSTAAVFGVPTILPIAEDEKKKPISPYGVSKLMVEKMLDVFDKLHGMKSISLRYFNAAGADPGQDAGIGELHVPETHLIPIVLEAALGKRDYVSVFGDDYDTKDGSCVRDYIHVNDLAAAHILSLEKLLNGANSNKINLGTGDGNSVFEVIEKVKLITGKDFDVVVDPRRKGDPPILTCDNSLAREYLGWKVTRSLDEQIRDAYNFILANNKVKV